MKKLLSVSPVKVYIACGLGLFLSIGAFWHHQVNQTELDRMSILNQGIGTCFNRISQTFTAIMIKDFQSSYLQRSFMGLSDECLNETIKGINPFKRNVGKGFETLNQLIGEVHWFHEKVIRLHTPIISGKAESLNVSMAPISERYTKMENYKLNLIDEIEASSGKLRDVQMNDEILMGAGLIFFILSLSLLSLQELNRAQLRKEIEGEALNYLATGKASVGAMVDRLVDRALLAQQMPVTAQIFRDYHADFLERMAARKSITPVSRFEEEASADPDKAPSFEKMEVAIPSHRTSLKEILVSIQSILPKESIHFTEVRDVQLSAPPEATEQMLNSAITQLCSRKTDGKKVMISNQIHTEKCVLNIFLAGSMFSVSELEFASGNNPVDEGIDLNLLVLKEMVQESGAQWHLENKVDKAGNITGMNIRFVMKRVPKESKAKNLVSVMRGKKKDLKAELMN